MINDAHLHLLVNHFPIVGLIISLLVLIFGLLLKNQTVKKTAVLLVLFSSLTSIPAYYSGENAEDVVENIPSISETLIHTHEEKAEFYFRIMLALGVIAVVVFVVDKVDEKWSRPLYFILVLSMVFCIYIAKEVGTSGGEIRHTEIRNSQIVIDYD